MTPIGTATDTVIREIPVSRNAVAVALAPGGKTAYVALNALVPGGRGAVIPVSTSTYKVGKPVRVGILPATMLITPDGKTVYAGDWDSGTVTPISTAANTARPAIRVAPRHGEDFTAVIAPDGRTVYVGGDLAPGFTRGFVVPVSTATGAIGRAIVFRGLPYQMALTPDGKTLYVVCAGDVAAGAPQDVVPISTTTGTAGKAINTGLQPVAIAITGSHKQR